MPRLPDKNQLGQADSFRSGRSVATITGDPGATGNAMMSAVGGGISKLAGSASAVIEESRKEDDALDLIKAESRYKKGLLESEQGFDADPDFNTYGQRHAETSRGLMDESAALIRNPRVREKWAAKADLEGEQSYNRVLDKGLKLQREAKVGEVDDILKGYRSQYADPNADDARRAAVLRDMDAAVMVGERSGLLSPAHAKALRDKHIEGAYSDDAEARMWSDPHGLLKDLQSVPGGSSVPVSGGNAIDLIKKLEGTRDMGWDYRQYSGPYGVKRGKDERLTLPQAEERLQQEVGKVESEIDARLPGLPANQKAALTSLFYNMGTGKGRLEQVAKLIESGQADKVPGWIKQFTRNADGGYMKGLANRRQVEADLFAKGETEMPQSDGTTIVKSDLPSVEDMQMSQRYAKLSPERRRALITRTRIALSATSQQEIQGDVERMLRGEQPEVDENGMTSMERAAKVLQPNQVRKFQSVWDEARMTRDAVGPMGELGRADRQKHLSTIDPDNAANKDRYSDSYKSAVRAQRKAEAVDKALTDLEARDPVEAVDPHRENEMRKAGLARRTQTVSTAYEMIQKRIPGVRVDSDGTVTPSGPDQIDAARQARGQIIDARLQSQEERGIPAYARRPISKVEAARLLDLPDDVNRLTAKELKEALSQAQQRINSEYGPRYAGPVMKAALELHIKNQGDSERKPLIEDAARAAQRSSQGWMAIDRDRRMKSIDDLDPIIPYDQAQRLDRIERTFDPTPTPRSVPAAPAGGTATGPKPNEKQIDILLRRIGSDPDAVKLFDRAFGQPGLAAKILKERAPQP